MPLQIGEAKNMTVVEYGHDLVMIECGGKFRRKRSAGSTS